MQWTFLLLASSLIVASCNSNSHSINTDNSAFKSDSSNKTVLIPSEFTYQIIDAADNTFGYQIFQNGKILVNQPHIPGITGVTGFKTKEDAMKVAELVIEKIKKNQMPPTVTTGELDSLGAIY